MTDGSGHAATMEMRTCPQCGRHNPADAHFCAGCAFAFDGALASPQVAAQAVAVAEPEVLQQVAADPLIGTVIADRYRLVSLLGRGGMGVVYKVEHVRIGKLMAMKLLHGELARDKDTVRRFKREAETASRLAHPNTVQIFDFGRTDHLMYLVMEYLPGKDLGQILAAEGPMPFVRAARICAQICGSVAEAHAAGVVHRDLKPENVMILQTKQTKDLVKVLDFGLAKLREGEKEGNITRAGSLVGTPYYMAPEHIRGEPADPRSDLYAIGAVLYKCVTGVPPFTSNTPVGVLTKHLTEPVVPPSERTARKDLPLDCDAIVVRAMQKDPEVRYQRAEDLAADLVRYLDSVGEPLEAGSSSRLRAPSFAPAMSSIETASGRRAVLEVATRGDIDRYETRLRRFGWLTRAAMLTVVLAAVGAGAWFWTHRTPTLRTTELEPNDMPADASPLPVDVPVTGYLGKRQSQTNSDADVYVLRNPSAASTPFRLEVSAIPNMDLVLDVVREGQEQPVLRADSGGVGEPEHVPNFAMEGRTYFVRVREYWVAGHYPTENVSDPYTIVWHRISPGEREERELNDAPELAGRVRVGVPMLGVIGWGGDVDWWCFEGDAPAVVASLSGVQGLDLALRVADRREDTFVDVDAEGPGAGETSAPITSPHSRTCFQVSASTARVGARASETQYELRLTGVAAP